MRRRDFGQALIGVGGALLSALGCSQGSRSVAGEQTKKNQGAGSATEAQMLQDARNALPYRKPKGLRNGFDGLNMHQVLEVTRRPAVRVKLEMAGKPQAAQLADGTIVVAGFIEPPVHEKSRCTLRYSRDNGRTFSEPRVLDLGGRTFGFRALTTGTLVLAHGSGSASFGSMISRSTNGGESWTSFEIPKNLTPGDQPYTLGECHGPIELPGNTLLMHLARAVSKGSYAWEAYVIRSTDDGRTWGDPSRVPTETDSDEISYARLPSGRILGVTRSSAAMIRRDRLEEIVPGGREAPLNSEAGDASYQFHSDDSGRNWSHPKPTGLGVLQAAGAYPLPLSDGRILLLYGSRVFPYGTQVVGSRDGGETWDLDHPIFLSWHSWSGYCGHPRSVQLQDGTILTGYYTHRIDVEGDGPPDPARTAPPPHHNQEDTGELIRWRVPDDWPPRI